MKTSDFTPTELSQMADDGVVVGILLDFYKAVAHFAKNKGLTYYQQVGMLAGLHERNLGPYMEWISRYTHTRHKFLMSSLITHKHGEQKPGSGFFTLAADLGYEIKNNDAFWIKQVNLTHQHFSRPQA